MMSPELKIADEELEGLSPRDFRRAVAALITRYTRLFVETCPAAPTSRAEALPLAQPGKNEARYRQIPEGAYRMETRMVSGPAQETAKPPQKVRGAAAMREAGRYTDLYSAVLRQDRKFGTRHAPRVKLRLQDRGRAAAIVMAERILAGKAAR